MMQVVGATLPVLLHCRCLNLSYSINLFLSQPQTWQIMVSNRQISPSTYPTGPLKTDPPARNGQREMRLFVTLLADCPGCWLCLLIMKPSPEGEIDAPPPPPPPTWKRSPQCKITMFHINDSNVCKSRLQVLLTMLWSFLSSFVAGLQWSSIWIHFLC